ncbi:MAG: hypothetical protein EP329_27315 [Deltaproteobacteria bacterium]|nr:MAG: hypothetical protein EP329_27315 [Deltaproteobacteria bacterium]
MRSASLSSLVALSWCAVGVACADALPSEGGRLAVDIAALELTGVGDVVWDVEVVNGASEVVWHKRLSSTGYGDGAGSASYVGTCDAAAGVAENTIRVWVVGVYADPVAAFGAFSSGAATGAGAVTGTPLDFQNPTVDGPLTRTATCVADTDVAVQLDVALMRPAAQGFFDVAVSFNDVFCSAKLDCCDDSDGTPGCAVDGSEDLNLLYDAAGDRARTVVFGLACTAGAADTGETELLLDPLTLDCTDPYGAAFTADLTIDPAAGPGNLCTAGAVASCAAVTAAAGVDADSYLFQVATYRGTELLQSGGVAARKIYWNVALGAAANLGDCRLMTAATADDAADDADGVVDGVVAAGAVYPFVAWDVDLGTCGSEQLSFGDPSAAVTVGYTPTDGGGGATPTPFGYRFGPSVPAGAVCESPCLNGGVCSAPNTCDCSQTIYTGPTCATPAFSGTIYFASTRTVSGESHIYGMALDGSGVALVTNGASCKSFFTPYVSPNGNALALKHDTDGNCVYVTDTPVPSYYITTSGTGLRSLSSTYTALATPFVWSPDSTRVAAVHSTSGLMPGYMNVVVVTAATGATTSVTTNSVNYMYSQYPTWSPDSARIAYADNTTGNYEIFVANANGTGKTNLTSNAAYDTMPAWSPDGTRIAFTTNRDGNTEIYTMATDGSNLVNLTQTADNETNGVVWSPDGTRIAYRKASRLWVMNADGSGQTLVTPTVYAFSSPVWASTSAHLVFESSSEIYRVAVDGSGLTNLTNDPASDTAPTL